MAQEILRLVALSQIVKESFGIIAKYHDYRELQMAIAFLQMKFYIKFRMSLRKNRGLNEKYRQ